MMYTQSVQQFDFSHSQFENKISIPPQSQIIFVADLFANDYLGGAELTTQALIEAIPVDVFKIHSRDVTMDLLSQGKDRFWIFGNFCELQSQLFPSIISNLKYSIIEYDYKFCRARSPEKHQHISGSPCDCHLQVNGKMISAFFYGAMGLWWMSEKQKQRYFTIFPFLEEKNNTVLSSAFDIHSLTMMRNLALPSPEPRSKWIVLGSNSWIKGADTAEQWCKDNAKDYEVVWNLPYVDILNKLSLAKGFVYLPKGGDTCPRMVIEAKLLGCELHLNDDVQHADEPWFATDDVNTIFDHLSKAPGIFWAGIKRMMEYKPKISGYTTIYNGVTQKYPFIQCIKSMLEFCDEVCIVDGGSTDVTFDVLVQLAYPQYRITTIEDLRFNYEVTIASGESSYEFPDEWHDAKKDPRIRVKVVPRNWSSKRHPVFDGAQKAEARAMCTGEFCWQMDSDEVVHEDDAPRIADICRMIPKGVDIISLPVIEYWGGQDKVRCDVQPWKWRLSRNLPHITHGIPVELRRTDVDGQLYAGEGTDGCDMIDAQSGKRLAHASFYTPDVDAIRVAALGGSAQALRQYEQWYNQTVLNIPSVFHYSWYDLPRKMKLYRDYWQNHWAGLWDKDTSDTAKNNMMFGVPWSQVTDKMIEERAAAMKTKLGGWIWHRQWDGVATTPHITCTRSQPKVMR